MDYHWYDFLGNLGVGLIIVSYLLLQLGRMHGQSRLYTGVNALGASLIIVSLLFDFNLSAFIVEVFWLGISIVGLLRKK
jgi:hypothetical protein